MNNRNYNIYFHTHTVSGIVISVVLFVIFFAGSFSFFKEEINNWERSESVIINKEMVLNTETILDSINKKYPLHARTVSLYNSTNSRKLRVSLEASKDSLAAKEAKESQYFILDTKTFQTATYDDSYSLGEFLYRLHFLAQIPYPVGYYLSGFVALFFLFAIVTGVLLHWQKIVSNFYLFRPKEKLKTMWTDAHTSLGVLGLPFQFVYAVTGAFFMIKLVIVAPVVIALYDGNQDKLYQDLEYSTLPYEYKKASLKAPYHINELVADAKTKWNDFDITEIKIENYGDANMHLTIGGQLSPKQKFTGNGELVYKVASGKIIKEKHPYAQTTYLDGVKSVLYRIHFADYGGYALKIISFVLGIVTCFVIISGVMIWLVARDKKNIPEKKRRFNRKVVLIYLAICLSMYPITAFTFIVCKLFYPLGQSGIYSIYFVGWLLLTVFFIVKRNDAFTTKYSLLAGSILGFLVPVSNGIVTGKWFWTTYNDEFQLFFVDVFWIILASISLYAVLKRKNIKKQNSQILE
ncbi:PepSY-associated TM helix domain-containing protein [Flavobacterium marginilacus]|uniref:PepSY-associated TM helix domain-containing protein n=1 Tax=Flavobacterium marginilacus TaxID=3003256 RepID=UPI00248DE929|nr:PepSY-associated TM helix domain-containing protein [Flavobacterium marginilacus]